MSVQSKPKSESHILVYDDLVPEYVQDFLEFSILGRAGDRIMHPTVQFKCKYEDTAVKPPGTRPCRSTMC